MAIYLTVVHTIHAGTASRMKFILRVPCLLFFQM